MNLMKYVTKITLYNSYFDKNNNLSAKAILSIFQDVAAFHAEEIGVGYKEMLNKNLYWVLSRIKFDILKMPQIDETVFVETWPQEKGRIDFDRDFKILSETGEVYVIGSSKWCVIDASSRSLCRTDGVNYIGEYCNQKNYEEKFNKIVLPNTEQQFNFVYKVMFSDLDHNNHMNNTNYANLAVNAINNKQFTHFEINFLNESLLNDEITVCSIQDKDSEYIVGKINQKYCFVIFVK